MIRALKESDIPGLNALPPADWKLDYESLLRDFLKQDYFRAFVLIHDKQIVGTGNVFMKGKVGWLAHILVKECYRNKGFGGRITEYLSDYLEKNNCTTQLLIATELGEPVYDKLGFKKITDYQRFETEVGYNCDPVEEVRLLNDSDKRWVFQMDYVINGEDRSHLIDRFYKNGLGYFNRNNALLGFYLPEFGRGLILSIDSQAGKELLKLKHSKKGARTLLPVQNQEGIQLLKELELKTGPGLTKMVLGEGNSWKPEHIYSYGTGYCG